MARPQITKLNQAGITTVAQFANVDPADRPSGISQVAFDRLQQQARLQVHQRGTSKLACERLAPRAARRWSTQRVRSHAQAVRRGPLLRHRGRPLLRRRPRVPLGRELSRGRGAQFRPFWGLDHQEEKRAFEEFVDFVFERRERYPDLHVYHYAPYERTALGRLMGKYGSREDEVDTLFRERVLVDLYRVVEQSMMISRPSYSLKEVEHFYDQDRAAAVKQAGDSVLLFERWRDEHDQSLLDGDRGLQQGGLRLHAASARVAARATRSLRGQVQDRDPMAAAGRADTPSENASEAAAETLALQEQSSRRRSRRSIQALRGGGGPVAVGAAPRLPPEGGKAGLLGVLRTTGEVRCRADRVRFRGYW